MKLQNVVEQSKKLWLKSSRKYDEKIVSQLFPLLLEEKGKTLLNNTKYFENYIWHFFNKKSSKIQILSIVVLLSYKLQKKINLNEFLINIEENPKKFCGFFDIFLDVFLQETDFSMRLICVELLINLFQNLEYPILSKELSSLVGIDIIFVLSEENRERIFKKNRKENYEERYNTLMKKNPEKRRILPKIIKNFVQELRNIQINKIKIIKYLEKVLELIVDLLSSFLTRKFIRILLNDYFVLLISKNKTLSKSFLELQNLFMYYYYFNIDEIDGDVLDREDVMINHSDRISKLQKICFEKFNGKVKKLSICSKMKLFDKSFLFNTLKMLSIVELKELCDLLEISYSMYGTSEPNLDVLLHVFANSIKPMEYETEKEYISLMTSFFTEKEINVEILSYPKANIDFLGLHDYFLRFFLLFRKNTFVEIKKLLEYNLSVISPYKNIDTKKVDFLKLNKNCLSVLSFKITQIAKMSLINEKIPQKVLGSVQIQLENVDTNIRLEWEQIKRGDLLYLLSFSFVNNEVIVKYIRGCEVEYIEDEEGTKFTGEGDEFKSFTYGTKIIVCLDPIQYYIDTQTKENEYESFDLVVRVKKSQIKSKKIIDFLRKILQQKDRHKIEEWCEEVLLGKTFEYDQIESVEKLRLLDIFNNLSGKNFESIFEDELIENRAYRKKGPFLVTFPKNEENEMENEIEKPIIIEKSAINFKLGYKETINESQTQQIKYSVDQLQAIVDGIRNGVTIIDGDSYTGKTHIIKEIIMHFYKNFPTQKTLVLTKTKFDKINVMLQGVRNIDLFKFELSKTKIKDYFDGKISKIMDRLKFLLGEIREIVKVMNGPQHIGFSCETSGYFYNSLLKNKIEKVKKMDNFDEFNLDEYGYMKIFPDREVNSFEKIKDKNLQIENLFKEVEELRFLELIKDHQKRRDYIVYNKAKVFVLSSDNLFENLKEMIENNFQFDNLIVSETNSFFDFEILSILVNITKIKRIILCGNENNNSQKSSNFSQSLVKRLKRVNLNYITLNEKFNTIESKKKNVGFKSNYWFINVGNYQGNGEICPFENLYQNLGEAEYIVQVFMYMRLLKYEKEKILILTYSRGQKKLIKEVLERRCKFNPVFDVPYKVSTIKEYDGEKVDYILVSLVRTKEIENIFELKKLEFVFSRAISGLYVFFNKELYINQFPNFKILVEKQRDFNLHLVLNRKNVVVKSIEQMGDIVCELTKTTMTELKKKQEEFLSSLLQKK